MLASEILGIEPGGFIMLMISAGVLIIAVPIAARIGAHDSPVFRRTSVVYGLVLLVMLFGAVAAIKITE